MGGYYSEVQMSAKPNPEEFETISLSVCQKR